MLAQLALAILGWIAFAACTQPPERRPAAESSPRPDEGRSTGEGRPQPGDPSRPRSEERAAEREAMVARQIAARGVQDERVLAAMRAVPRHWFVPASVATRAYDDHPLPIPGGQTISQPYVVAVMTEALRLEPASKVLEIGTGSGYQAAVLSEITPHVFTIEIVPELARWARDVFARHGYTTIRAREGDGYLGWPEEAPFDAIVITAAPDHVPPALVEQLAPGGRLCLPLEDARGEQELVVLTKQADGSTRRENLGGVRFVPMTGAAEVDGS